jgi:PPOX class probable F420-dependent enzyme
MSFAAFEKEPYLSLTTYRKNGEGVATPMWFVMRDGKIYMRTGIKAAKLKRIANQPRVTLQPCNGSGRRLHGSPQEGTARPLPDSDLAWIEPALNAKYGLMKKVLNVVHALARVQVTVFEIEPTT